MSFNGEVTFGHIIIAITTFATILGAYHSLKGKLDIFHHLLQSHNDRVDRLERRHEERLTMLESNERRLTTVIERIIGQNEERIRWDGHERRSREREQ